MTQEKKHVDNKNAGLGLSIHISTAAREERTSNLPIDQNPSKYQVI